MMSPKSITSQNLLKSKIRSIPQMKRIFQQNVMQRLNSYKKNIPTKRDVTFKLVHKLYSYIFSY